MNWKRQVVWLLAGWMAMTGVAQALDRGAPVYRDNVYRSIWVEGMFSRFDREVKLGSEETSMDQNIYMLRLHVAGDQANMFFNAGIVDDDRRSGQTPFALGTGVHIMTYDSDYARISLQVDGHYVPEHDITTSGFLRGVADYYGLAGGIVFSGKISHDLDRFQLVPYVGLQYSMLRGNRNIKVTDDDGRSAEIKLKVEERTPAAVYVGAAAIFNEAFTARLEYSFIDDSSFSLAVGVVF